MSCVLANRVVLNVREISRDINLSRQPVVLLSQKGGAEYDVPYHVNISSPGRLTEFEMEQLRSMRAKSHRSEVIELYNESEPRFRVL